VVKAGSSGSMLDGLKTMEMSTVEEVCQQDTKRDEGSSLHSALVHETWVPSGANHVEVFEVCVSDQVGKQE
jgi:hypothetical protein